MRSISVTMNVSLDGVVHGLGRPDEDDRGGFAYGGWGTWHQDEVLAQELGNGTARPGDMLFGRRTWQDFITAWAHREAATHAVGLIDHYTLVIHPVALGSGSRLFQGPAPLTRFELTSSVPTTTGVIVAHYDRL